MESPLQREQYYLHLLSDAYFALLSKPGVKEVSVKDICLKAGVSRSNFYRLVKDRDYQRSLALFRIHFSLSKYLEQARGRKERVIALISFAYGDSSFFRLVLEKNRGALLEALYLEGEEEEEKSAFLSLFPLLEKGSKTNFSEDEQLFARKALAIASLE